MHVPRGLLSRWDKDPQECRCGHSPRAHEHYRRGTDCALCECARFKAARSPRQSRPSSPPTAGSTDRERVRAA